MLLAPNHAGTVPACGGWMGSAIVNLLPRSGALSTNTFPP
jgi:hypothetical protein